MLQNLQGAREHKMHQWAVLTFRKLLTILILPASRVISLQLSWSSLSIFYGATYFCKYYILLFYLTSYSEKYLEFNTTLDNFFISS